MHKQTQNLTFSPPGCAVAEAGGRRARSHTSSFQVAADSDSHEYNPSCWDVTRMLTWFHQQIWYVCFNLLITPRQSKITYSDSNRVLFNTLMARVSPTCRTDKFGVNTK